MRQLLWLLVLPAGLHAQEEKSAKRGFLSPDKQWECRVIDESVVLLKAGSDAPVLNLNEEIGRVMVHEEDEDWEYLGCAVLFRGKCDNRGGWKVTLSRELSDAEADKINETED